MAKSEITTLPGVLASIVGFNGTKVGRKCQTGPDLLQAWKLRQQKLKRFTALALAKEHWREVYRVAWKLTNKHHTD